MGSVTVVFRLVCAHRIGKINVFTSFSGGVGCGVIIIGVFLSLLHGVASFVGRAQARIVDLRRRGYGCLQWRDGVVSWAVVTNLTEALPVWKLLYRHEEKCCFINWSVLPLSGLNYL